MLLLHRFSIPKSELLAAEPSLLRQMPTSLSLMLCGPVRAGNPSAHTALKCPRISASENIQHCEHSTHCVHGNCLVSCPAQCSALCAGGNSHEQCPLHSHCPLHRRDMCSFTRITTKPDRNSTRQIRTWHVRTTKALCFWRRMTRKVQAREPERQTSVIL